MAALLQLSIAQILAIANMCYIVTRGPTLQKILYEISKSFDFIEISLISCDFVKHLKLAISKEKLIQIIPLSNQTFKFITKHRSAQ